MKRKEEALTNFIELIKNAWTVDKMTKEEKNRLFETLNNTQTQEALKGSYNQRWEILQAIFTSYLMGLGYNGYNWRETERQPF